MSKTVVMYGGLLALSLGAAWVRYTSDEAAPKEGVVVVEGKPAELAKVVYDAPELDVTFELREDAFGRHGWVTVEEVKTKKVDGAETKETKVTRFKAGSAADKMLEGLAPLMALRELKDVDAGKLASFGLDAPTTKLTVSLAGKDSALDVGGETYGTKDVYVRDNATQRIFVVDDELFKALKFAGTRLPERQLVAAKVEDIAGITLAKDADSVSWDQQNRDDRAAAYWKRGAAEGKDETFGNWFDKFLKVKSVNYVQDGEAPADLVNAFSVTVRAETGPAETVQFLTAGEEWFAKSESTRGLVKLPRGSAKDAADDVLDVLEGKAPPEEPAAAPAGAGDAKPPTVSVSRDEAQDKGTSSTPKLPMPDLAPVPPKKK